MIIDMRMSCKKILSSQKGMTIISVTVTISIVTFIVASLIVLILNQLSLIRRNALENQAYYLAKAGINAAVEDLRNGGNGNLNVDLEPGQDFTRGYQTNFDSGNDILTSKGVIKIGNLLEDKTITGRVGTSIENFFFQETFNNISYRASQTTASWGSGRLILPYNEGGWTQVSTVNPPNPSSEITDMVFINETRGTMIGYYTSGGATSFKMETIDGGKNWTTTTLYQTGILSTGVKDLEWDGRDTWIAGGKVLKNGREVYTDGNGGTFYGIASVPSKNVVIVVGCDHSGSKMVRSDNSGSSWYRMDDWSGWRNTFKSIDLELDGNGQIVGGVGSLNNLSRFPNPSRSDVSGGYAWEWSTTQYIGGSIYALVGPPFSGGGLYFYGSPYRVDNGAYYNQPMNIYDTENGIAYLTSSYIAHKINGNWYNGGNLPYPNNPRPYDPCAISYTGSKRLAYAVVKHWSDKLQIWRWDARQYYSQAQGVSTNINTSGSAINTVILSANQFFNDGSESIQYQINVTGNLNENSYWENVSLNTPHAVSHEGKELHWRAILNRGTNATISPYLDDIIINYQISNYKLDRSSLRSE